MVIFAAGSIRAEKRSKHTSTDKRGRTGDTHNGVGERLIKEPISTAIKSKTEKTTNSPPVSDRSVIHVDPFDTCWIIILTVGRTLGRKAVMTDQNQLNLDMKYRRIQK